MPCELKLENGSLTLWDQKPESYALLLLRQCVWMFTAPLPTASYQSISKERKRDIKLHTQAEKSIHVNSFHLLWRDTLRDRIEAFCAELRSHSSFVNS